MGFEVTKMNQDRKKELREQYKNRRPEMGVVALTCAATGDSFLGPTTDAQAMFNGLRVKLNGGSHPNKRLQALWKEHGEAGFSMTLVETFDYDDPKDDHKAELELLRDMLLERDPAAKKIWL